MEKKRDITIYYFSGTGNSLKLSLDISAQFLKSDIHKICETKRVERSDSEMIGFVFPVYMGGLPGIVYRFLQNFPFEKDVYYFSIGTYYAYKGCAMSIVKKIMSDKGITLSYSNCLPTVGNCLKEYEVTQKRRIPILERAEGKTFNIISDLKGKVKNKTPQYCQLFDTLHKKLFKLFFDKAHEKFTLEERCIGCGVCQKVCPVNNIVFDNGKPEWKANCEVCHACVHWCPQNAINIGKSKGRLQYQNPAIKNTMLFTQKEKP